MKLQGLQILLLAGLAPVLYSQTAVTVVLVTATQATLSYSCANTSVATIEVSESNTYTPLVNAVNPALFTGAGQDAGGDTGPRPKFVIGIRDSPLDLNGNYTSRALQALTTHYGRISGCGAGSPIPFTFTTGNLLLSSSYLDWVQMDRTSPGSYIAPTLTNSRSQVIIDPYQGTKITRISLPADSASDGGGGTGPFLNFGGFIKATGRPLVNSGTGWLNLFPQGNGGFPELFLIDSTTHAGTYLGRAPGGWSINETDGLLYDYDTGADTLTQYTYTGTFAPAASGTVISTSPHVVLSSVSAAMQAFNPTCTAANYPISFDQVIGDFVYLLARRGTQDTYGCVLVVRISTGLVVAATRTLDNIQDRWCMIHNTIANGESASMFIGVHNAVGQSPPLGGGPYIVTYTSGGTMPGGPTTITVSGEPACAGCGADSLVPIAQTGDTFHFQDGTNETVTILNKISSTSWNISATSNAHSTSTTMDAACSNATLTNFPVVYWKFLLDPLGTDSTNTNFLRNATWPVGGHDDGATFAADSSKDLRITEDNGWVGKTGTMLTNLPNGVSFSRAATNFFAGAEAICFGDGCRRHPSTGPPGLNWGTDLQIWDQVPTDATLTPISGFLYKYNIFSFPLTRKYLPTATRIGHPGGSPSGWKSLLDISAPGAVLGTGAGDNYKYCVPNVVNECHNPSAIGDIFVNVPGSPNNCGGAGQNPNADSPCISNYNSWSSQVVQWGVDGTNARGLGGAVFAVMDTLDTPSAKPLPDGSGILFAKGNYQNNTPSQMLLVKTTPFTAPDTTDRTKFVGVPISLTNPGGVGATTAGIKFGYLENGWTATNYYCTSRAETCVAISSSAPPTNGTTDPFKYLTTDITNGTWTGAGTSCASTCTVILPVLPGHVVYYQPIFMDVTNTIVATGTADITGDPVGTGIPPANNTAGKLTIGGKIK